MSGENLAATLGMTDVARLLLANLTLNFSNGPERQQNWAFRSCVKSSEEFLNSEFLRFVFTLAGHRAAS